MIDEQDFRESLRRRADAIDATPSDPPVALRRARLRLVRNAVIGALAVALLGLGTYFGARSLQGSALRPANPSIEQTPAIGPATNGWVAIDEDRDIYLVRPGEDARRLEVAGSDAATEACPAWSPDGTRLLFGRVTGSSDSPSSDVELVIVPVDKDGAAGTPTVIGLDGFEVLPGFDPHPCGTWAPDGRWVAFGGNGEVWVVDTQTGAIRHLPDLRPSDLEWRPGTDELAIAGDMGTTRAAPTLSTPVTVYSVSTGELHQLGSVEAALITWSSDGTTLAYTGGETDPPQLWLVDGDGANERLLVAHLGGANHGIGPVWSPTGDRIAYQRLIGGRGEAHEVVLVNVADGKERVIEPPVTDGPDGRRRWYPRSVSWSPDGTTLLYAAWFEYSVGDEGGGTIAVPADMPSDVTVLADGLRSGAGEYDHRWAPIQIWGRQQGTELNLPRCDRANDRTVGPIVAVAGDGCLEQTALALGYEGPLARRFEVAYRICFDTSLDYLAEKYGGGSTDPDTIARTFSNRIFHDDSGLDACKLALADRS